MNKRQQEQFAAFFQEIYETEELLDFIKLQLGQSRGYNPNLIFDLISNRQEHITIQQMSGYLEDNVACNERELYEIFERFDWTRQGSISRTDFLNEITPFGKSGPGGVTNGGTITSEIEGHFISLLVEILKRFRILEVGRKQLKFIQPYDAFSHIDYLKTGHLGIGQLRKLFFDNDFKVTDRQLYYLLHGLRRRCYRDINMEVFCENLDPTEFGFYLAYQSKLDEIAEKDYLNRSRNEEQTMKRSRVQAQRIEHEFQKAERKRQAELERQLELEDRVDVEILKHEEEKERQIRRALLEEDRDIRHNIATGREVYRQEHARIIEDKIDNEYLDSIRRREEEVNAALASSALKRQKELERSRRTIEQERQLLYREEVEREKNLLRSAAVAREVEQSRRRTEEESRRRYQFQNLRRYQDDRSKFREEDDSYTRKIAASRKQIEQSRKIQEQSRRKPYQDSTNTRQKLYRELQLQKQRAREELTNPRNNHNRSSEYEKELERTRYQIQQRRSRMAAEDSMRSYR